MEPSEDKISQVIDFASLDPVDDRFMVTQALKGNGQNVETVVMQYFDDASSFRQKYQTAWDESMFAADRDGGNNSAGISFHVESSDQNIIQGVTPPPPSDAYGPVAPSRPPSRSNNRSPIGRMVDWTAGNTQGLPDTQAQEDEDMARALRQSAQEAGISMQDHETGITEPSASAPHFGPAQRSDYEETSWAMVTVPGVETNSNTMPAPSLRKRAPGVPAFLVQGKSHADDHQLGALLTILHAIPLARNLLLQSGLPAASYGHNSEWWMGQEILPPHVLAQLQNNELRWGDREKDLASFEEELHRLMAFLDATERGFGTVSVLTDIIPSAHLGAEKQFYDVLSSRNSDIVRPLMQIATLVEVHDGDDGAFDDAKFGLLEMDHVRADYSGIKTLYESFDHVMWSDVLGWKEVHDTSKMAMFKEIGDVFAIKITGDGPEDAIEIPLEFYPEKYMSARKEEARQIQLGWCKTKKAMDKVVEEEQRIYQWRDAWNSQILDRRDLIKRAKDQWAGYYEYLDGLARFEVMEKSGFDTDKYPDYRAAPTEQDGGVLEAQYGRAEGVIRFSERLLAGLEVKMKGLNKELEQIKARQRFLGRLLTVPDKPGRPKSFTSTRFLLRGVATKKDVVYVCQRGEADLIELDDAPKPVAEQWWRMAYDPNEEQPVKAEKVEVERVLRDMWLETKNPMLVYASERALDTPCEPLSSPLERFMKAENKAFRQELNAESTETRESRSSVPDVVSPSKRKHRSDSADSMDSNRASLGSDDRNGFDNPFLDQYDSVGTEMTEMEGPATNFAKHAEGNSPAVAAEISPPLPARRPDLVENASATVTPSSEMADAWEETDGRDKQQEGKLEDDDNAVVRKPEMQERVRPPSLLVPLSRTTSTDQKPNDMDLL